MNSEIILDDLIAEDNRSVVVIDTLTYRETWTRQDGFIHIHHEYPLAKIFAENLRRKNEFSRTSKLDDMVHIGTVHKAMHIAWENEGRTEDEKSLRRFFNDSDNANFRVNSLIL